MNDRNLTTPPTCMAPFDRQFLDPAYPLTYIGSGGIGGKAHGLVQIRDILAARFHPQPQSGIAVAIPAMTVVATDVFDWFMRRNDLFELAYSDAPDDRIAHGFQRAELPTEILGDLQSIVATVKTPLAIRSSSLLEDAMYEPFAGVYATKMIPNNQPEPRARFQKLVEAIKFVYASVFFKEAKGYIAMTKNKIEAEKMAVVIQEVAGQLFYNRYYPHLAGVARSYNFYPIGHAAADDGVVDLALGLGKTIVDGGRAWTYSPAYPLAPSPYGSIRDLLKNSQTEFWSVNMGKPPEYDPIRETEYLSQLGLEEADYDGTLRFVASTFDPENDRLMIGVSRSGPRVINFAPLLAFPDIPVNDVIRELLQCCEAEVGAKVEIEFAVSLDNAKGLPARFSFLQVRPMVVSNAVVEVGPDDMAGGNVLAASSRVLGNGVIDTLQHVVYVRPDTFESSHTMAIAGELETINRRLTAAGQPYLLIGFGRWGSSDPWLGIPVNWSQISGAKVIIEATLPDMNIEMSQGSHFFHNITSFQVCYFSVRHTGPYCIDWEWLARQETVAETPWVRHVRLPTPLLIKVDGRSGRGVITHV